MACQYRLFGIARAGHKTCSLGKEGQESNGERMTGVFIRYKFVLSSRNVVGQYFFYLLLVVTPGDFLRSYHFAIPRIEKAKGIEPYPH
jgi:hypothetical protein